MKYFLLLPVIFLLACGKSVDKGPELSPPKFAKLGLNTLGWKKVTLPMGGEDGLPTDGERVLALNKIVGYVKVLQFNVDERTTVPSYEVFDENYSYRGNITNRGMVSTFKIDTHTRKPVQTELGEHTFEAGVARLLGLRGKQKYQLLITTLRVEDTYTYKREQQRVKEEASRKLAIENAKKAEEKKEEDE